ncbi:MAG: hypothetical protein ABSH53_05535 [Holophaga sp.]|jgi:hypothetical protein
MALPGPHPAGLVTEAPLPLPALDLVHLRRLTDSTGILQHARFSVPRFDEGYCLDDNARALLLATLLEAAQAEAGVDPDPGLDALACRYLAFVNHAFNPDRGRFRNFMAFSRTWLEPQGSDDSHGRALWALGAAAGRCPDPGRRELARVLFQAGLPAAGAFNAPRPLAYALLGIHACLAAEGPEPDLVRMERDLAGRLHGMHLEQKSEAWPWFEDRLTYGNARLPQALILAGRRNRRRDWLAAGLGALDWLARVQTDAQGRFAPVGSRGFYPRRGIRAWFDQQPVEACATVSACLDALAASGEPRWGQWARHAFEWFLGRNQLGLPLYDPRSGGCRDGLQPQGVNQNQGAESTLSFLLALQEMLDAGRA